MIKIEEAVPRRSFSNPAVTLGNFDGVHLGHLKIFQRLAERAKEIGGQSVVYTFQPHPFKVIHPDREFALLTSYEERARLIEASGVDVLICAPFDSGFARQSAEEFVERVLHDAIGAKVVLVGYDYAFGRGREGNIGLLKSMGERLGFEVEVISPVMMDGEVVSSSRIREAIKEGDITLANKMLGREYTLCGRVIRGHGRGKSLGYPTANILLQNELKPKSGVYAVRVTVPAYERPLGGVANLGTNPTFGEKSLSFEVHIFDFSSDIYGEQVKVSLVERLRDEIRFPTVDHLVEQIRKDEEQARQLLEK
jgi:riboflavin kinase/FMN adenylyltransferase